MDLDSLFTDGDIGKALVNPGSAIEIIDSALVLVQGGMSVAAENSRRPMVAGMGQGAVGDLLRQALPARAQPVEKTRHGFIFRIPLLQLQVEQRPDQIADVNIAHHEAVELVTVHGDVAQAPIFPLIFLVHADTDQMGHDFGQAVVVIAFDPDHFDVALGVGELANEAEKFPVFFFQASEIEVGENVAQQNEAAILIFLEHAQRLARAAHVRAEVQIGKDQRVISLRGDLRRVRRSAVIAAPRFIVAAECYEVMNRVNGREARGNLSVTCPWQSRSDGRRMACPAPLLAQFAGRRTRSLRWRNVFGGTRGSFAEEKLLHLLHDDFLILLARRVQAIFVQQYFAVFHPLAPRLLRDLLVDLFSQVAVEGRLGEPRQFLFQFCAENFVIGHKFLLKLSHRHRTCAGLPAGRFCRDGEKSA